MAGEQILFVLLLAALTSLSLSYPYQNHGPSNFNNANHDQLASYIGAGNQHDAVISLRNGGYQQSMPDAQPEDYYLDDEDTGRPTDREYSYGKPTYHGEYNPSRYYYARTPAYAQYDEPMSDDNPLSDLHEQMIEESRNRYLNYPVGKPQWFQNTGQPVNYANKFIKDLILWNQGIDPEALTLPEEYANKPYNLNNKAHPYNEYAGQPPLDYYDDLEVKQPFNRFESPSSFDKPNYFKFGNSDGTVNNNNNNDNGNNNSKQKTMPKSMKPPKPTKTLDELEADKDEEELTSLRKNFANDRSKSKAKQQSSKNNKSKTTTTPPSVHGYESSYDYDDDKWINWNRKRSYAMIQPDNMSPLKALEYQLAKSLQQPHYNEHITATPIIESTSTTTTTSTTPRAYVFLQLCTFI